MTYIGRFAPSPTGPLHRGSVVAAAASYLDARAHDGRWQLRIEDLDTGRCDPDVARTMINTLAQLGMQADEPVYWQSRRQSTYQQAFQSLSAAGVVYGCACTRAQVRRHAPHPGVYAGTCRSGLSDGRVARCARVRIDQLEDRFIDRLAGPQHSLQGRDYGDPVVLRADGSYAYVLAGAVDDAECGITDVVRGDDLLPTTATQRCLLTLLGLPTPRYAHVPVVRGADGRKLSKQNHAPAIDPMQPIETIRAAFRALGLPETITAAREAKTLPELWQAGVIAWRERLSQLNSHRS